MVAIFKVCLNWSLLSRPFSLAISDIAIKRGSACSSWRFNCGVTVGASPLAIFSNCARVISVLQSAGFLAAAGAAFAAPVFGVAEGFGVAGHTPLMVRTTAVSGTSLAGSDALLPAPGAGAGVAPGSACPQASVPTSTHSNQLLRIQYSSRIGRSGSSTTEPSILAWDPTLRV